MAVLWGRYPGCQLLMCHSGLGATHRGMRLTRSELPPIWKKSEATLIFSCPSTSCQTLWMVASRAVLAASYSSSAPALAADCQLGTYALSVFSFFRSTCTSNRQARHHLSRCQHLCNMYKLRALAGLTIKVCEVCEASGRCAPLKCLDAGSLMDPMDTIALTKRAMVEDVILWLSPLNLKRG